MKNKKKPKAEPSVLGALAAAPRGMAVFAAAALITSFPAAIIAYATSDPGSYVLPCGLCALYISSAAGGFAAYKFHGGLALLSGLFCGLAAAALSLLLSLILPLGTSPDVSAGVLLLSRLPIILLSVIGAYLASAKRKKKKKRKH